MGFIRGIAVAGGVVFASMMSTGSAAWAVDVCSLLTPAQASSALGVPDVNAGAGANRCIWTPKKNQQGAGQLAVQVEGDHDPAKITGMGHPLSGIGDEAIETIVNGSAVLHVRKGNTWFVVNLQGVPLDQAKQVEQTVARQIAEKL